MPYIGFVKSPYGPAKTYELILKELEKRGFDVTFSKHHWMGDAPFGLIIAETDRGEVAIRWNLGKTFGLKLEEVEKGDVDEFVEDTMEYLSGD
ncbi:hypothetical protein, conserved [Thermococcus onnurineus NA1]|uniref:Uncharacterized protein n=1 Tax=Thermococcus onnurineus (strain NA1) TaxID=523850 RepID=B6YT08_THEON|nr:MULTISPECIES: hypothetical protein [Thermococcus]ACJ15695.1 hypothetical protein, conserved [Thermococcus onnurineus NA1]NJE46966.1 hypothetical protein [Thermococcus sp. GR7]NJE78982.1 hypothetical protein [Thermococcus sp. GR4]NJF22674.1 hypothetical protein [Thermococcus sp. GR5]